MPDFDNADVARALASGRHVVSIVDSGSAVRRSVDIRLPRVGRNEAAEASEQATSSGATPIASRYLLVGACPHWRGAFRAHLACSSPRGLGHRWPTRSPH